MKKLKVFRVFGTRAEKDPVVPSFELAAPDVDIALDMVKKIELSMVKGINFKGPMTGIRETGEIIVP